MDTQVNEQIVHMDIPEIHHELLMELLEKTKEEENLAFMADCFEEKENNCSDNQLPVFRNSGALLNPDWIHNCEGCEDCGLEDILSGLDHGHECSVSPMYFVDDLLDWVEMDSNLASPSSVIDNQWHLEEIVCNSFYHGTGEYVEEGFCKLWE